MKFEYKDNLLLFHDDTPGAHVTLFDSAGSTVPFSNPGSSFDDVRRVYTWAFSLPRPPVEGQRFVFATAVRTVAGIFERGTFRAALVTEPAVERAGGKPVGLLSGFGGAVERALATPTTPTPPPISQAVKSKKR